MAPDAKPRLLDRVRLRLRLRHYSYRTEQQYVLWIRRFVLFHDKRHPESMGPAEIEAFLNDLAARQNVAAATQNQALAAILFLYRQVLHRDMPWLDHLVRAKKPLRLPVVLSAQETRALLSQLSGIYWLIGNLLYGSGLRLMECLQLRVRDLDFDYQQIMVRNGKGGKDRMTVLPRTVIGSLQTQLAIVRERHDLAMRHGYGGVEFIRRHRAEVSERSVRAGLAVRVSGHQAFDRSAQRHLPASPHLRRLGAASDEDRRAPRRH
jgi:site-specific recombinase XerD